MKSLLQAAAFGVAATLSGLLATASVAEELKIGIARITSSLDPHFSTASVNFPNNAHIFEPLVGLDDNANHIPALAVSWQALDDSTWEFKLREGVTWHDGSPFTAEDVQFSIDRGSGNVPGSPASYATYTRPIVGTEVIDDHTIHIRTDGPVAALLDNLSYFLIVSKKNSETATDDDFNSGEAVIGTGPYKYADWLANDYIVLDRNDDYWGGAEPWSRITIHLMPNASSRMAALLSGDIDVAESVPPQDVPRLNTDDRVSVWSGPSNLVTFISIDATEDMLTTGRITSPSGGQLDENPLADQRVREAMKIALNLEGIADRLYHGTAEPVGQFLLPGKTGHADDLPLWSFDEERARQLVHEAGWYENFQLTLSVADAHYPLSVQLGEIIAQSWTRVGIPTTVEVAPFAVFLERRNAHEIPVFTAPFANVWGTPENFYSTMFHSRTEDRSYGALNFGYYSNPEVDALIETGFATLDDAERSAIYAEATRKIVEDAQYIPVFLLHSITATGADLTYAPRADTFLMATNVRPAQ